MTKQVWLGWQVTERAVVSGYKNRNEDPIYSSNNKGIKNAVSDGGLLNANSIFNEKAAVNYILEVVGCCWW